MSDADPNDPPQDDVEQEDPRTTIKPETVVEGLSNIQRTAGKSADHTHTLCDTL